MIGEDVHGSWFKINWFWFKDVMMHSLTLQLHNSSLNHELSPPQVDERTMNHKNH